MSVLSLEVGQVPGCVVMKDRAYGMCGAATEAGVHHLVLPAHHQKRWPAVPRTGSGLKGRPAGRPAEVNFINSRTETETVRDWSVKGTLISKLAVYPFDFQSASQPGS